ncbi:MAG: endospore germination permease [Clostridia bacterium]|nr:endospore germination permease [Clostridia bacterium]
MLEQGKISGRQAYLLIINVILATAILFVPAVVSSTAKENGWLAAILATAVGIVISILIANLGLRFPDRNLFDYLGDLIGTLPGKIIALLYIWWFLHMTAEVVRSFGSFLVVAFLTETPISVFNFSILILAGWTVKQGLEVICRANEIFLPLILIGLIVLFLLALPEMDFRWLLPVMEHGVKPIIHGAITPISWYGQIATMLMIIPFLKQPQNFRKIQNLAVITIGFFFTMVVLGTVAIFGPELTPRFIFPTLNAARIINIANLLERLDPIVMAIWITGAFIKITFFYYVAALGTAQLLNLSSYRPVVYPLGIIIGAMSILIHPSILELEHFIGKIWPVYAITTFEVGIPVLLLLIAILRGKGGKSQWSKKSPQS